jgi:hypothetical protein
LVKLAHDYSIATPYTSLLVVPESAANAGSLARRAATRRRYRQSSSMPFMGGSFGGGMGMGGSGMAGMRQSGMAMIGGMAGMGGMGGGMGGMGGGMGGGGIEAPRRESRPALARDTRDSRASSALTNPSLSNLAPSGKEAIDLAQRVADLKTGARAETSTRERTIAGRRFRKIGEAWVDQTFKSSMATLHLRVFSKAYFRLLAAHPELSAIFALGNRVTWVTPSGTALVIDKQGQDDAAEATLDQIFAKASST